MKNTLSKVIIFAVGAAAGSAVTYLYLKNKYEQIINDEIDEMRNYYISKYESDVEEDIPEEVEEEPVEIDSIKQEIKAYAKIAEQNGYSEPGKIERMVNEVEKPYVISPDEYGEYQDYELINLVFYADGVLADDMDEEIDSFDNIVGENFMDHYGEYEDDTVFVRNDRLMADYEIQRDERNYSEVVGSEAE